MCEWIGSTGVTEEPLIEACEYSIWNGLIGYEHVRLIFDPEGEGSIAMYSLDCSEVYECKDDDIKILKEFQRFTSDTAQGLLKEIYEMRTKHGI